MHIAAWFACGLNLVAILSAAAAAAAEPAGSPRLRLEGATAAGAAVTLELLGLPPAEADAALRAGFTALLEAERQVNAAVEALNQGSQQQRAVPLERPMAELLGRAQDFCRFTQGAHGPLGGNHYDHWRATAGSGQPPPLAAGSTAACDRLKVELTSGTVTIAAGSRVELHGFARGFALDRAVAVIKERGGTNGWVEVGRLRRAFGPGPEGKGWRVELPTFEGLDRPLDAIHLVDRTVAIAWQRDAPGAGIPLFVDQRTGERAPGILAALAVSELALDAEALAATALAVGPREGRFRLSNLRPQPSLLWLLGTGTGRPLLTEVHWSLHRAK